MHLPANWLGNILSLPFTEKTNKNYMQNQIAVLNTPEFVSDLTTAILPMFRGDVAAAKLQVEAEKQGFIQALEKIKPEELAKVAPSEIRRAAISSVATGLSWAQEEGNFYLQTRNVNRGTKEAPNWGKSLELSISHRGETSLRVKQRIISYIKTAQVVFESDKIENLNIAKGTLDHIAAFPENPKDRVIAAYVVLVMPDGKEILRWFGSGFFEKLRKYSERQNKGTANELYSNYNGWIEPGFAIAKSIKHSFKGLPKCKTNGLTLHEDPEDTLQEPTVYDVAAEVVHSDTPSAPAEEAKLIVKQETNEFDF